MKKEETPQDKSALENVTRDVCYVKNENNEYETVLSSGWNVKKDALDFAWDEIKEETKQAESMVKSGKKSPVYFHMKKNMLTPGLLASYVKISRLLVWFHLKPYFYKNMNTKYLNRYILFFNLTKEEFEACQK